MDLSLLVTTSLFPQLFNVIYLAFLSSPLFCFMFFISYFLLFLVPLHLNFLCLVFLYGVSNSADNVDPALRSTLPVNTGVGTTQYTVMTPEDTSVPRTELRSEAVRCTVTDFKSKYSDCFEVRLFNAMFFDGCNAIIYDRRSVKFDTEIGDWNSCCNLMQSCCPRCTDPVGFLNTPFVRRKDESNYVVRLDALLSCADEVKGLVGLGAWCIYLPYD